MYCTDLQPSFCSVARLASQPPSVSWMAMNSLPSWSVAHLPVQVEPEGAGPDEGVSTHSVTRDESGTPRVVRGGGAKVRPTGISGWGAILTVSPLRAGKAPPARSTR
jgi:hypothetical protein